MNEQELKYCIECDSEQPLNYAGTNGYVDCWHCPACDESIECEVESEEQSVFNFGGHVTYIEDAVNAQTPVESQKTLSDEDLEKAGLIRTSAFVRTKKSKNALRIEKHKQKKAAQGVKQLNVEVPEEHREMIKSLTKSLKNGLPAVEAIKLLFPELKPDTPPSPRVERESEVSKIEKMKKSSRLKKFILELIGL